MIRILENRDSITVSTASIMRVMDDGLAKDDGQSSAIEPEDKYTSNREKDLHMMNDTKSNNLFTARAVIGK